MSNCLLKWMVWVSEFSYTLPKEYKEKNVLVEVRNGTLREACYSLNNSLLVALSVKSGQLRVMDKKTHVGLLCESVRGDEEWRKQVLEGWIHGYQWMFRLLLFYEYGGGRRSEETGDLCG